MAKARINAYVSDEVRTGAIGVLRPAESLSDLVEAALRAEIERRKARPASSTAGPPLRLPPGRRPK